MGLPSDSYATSLANCQSLTGIGSMKSVHFSRCLKVSSDGEEVTSNGRSFHIRAPVTWKARHPNLVSDVHVDPGYRMTSSRTDFRSIALRYRARSCTAIANDDDGGGDDASNFAFASRDRFDRIVIEVNMSTC